MEEREKAIEQVRIISPDAQNYRVINVHPDFMGGNLYVIAFEDDSGQYHNYVYANKSGEMHLSKNEALLLSWLSKKNKIKKYP